MIQRIQSIYLVLAGLFPAFTLFVPIVAFSNASLAFTMSGAGYEGIAQVAEMHGRHPYGLLFFAACSIVVSLLSIFAFKNRKKQMKQVKWGVWINVLWYVTFVVYAFSVKSRTSTDLSFEFGCLFPFFSILMQVLAKHAIKRDENLVRAADRIR